MKVKGRSKPETGADIHLFHSASGLLDTPLSYQALSMALLHFLFVADARIPGQMTVPPASTEADRGKHYIPLGVSFHVD